MAIGRPASKPRTTLGERIAAARQDVGITQQDLAQKAGVTQRVIAYWEREAVSLRADQINALATALNLTADELLGVTPPKPRRQPAKGKLHQVFESAAKLPRRQQQKIAEVVEALVAQHANGNSKPA
jgi:transcriptional regulator with XRE-family HTH domain